MIETTDSASTSWWGHYLCSGRGLTGISFVIRRERCGAFLHLISWRSAAGCEVDDQSNRQGAHRDEAQHANGSAATYGIGNPPNRSASPSPRSGLPAGGNPYRQRLGDNDYLHR